MQFVVLPLTWPPVRRRWPSRTYPGFMPHTVTSLNCSDAVTLFCPRQWVYPVYPTNSTASTSPAPLPQPPPLYPPTDVLIHNQRQIPTSPENAVCPRVGIPPSPPEGQIQLRAHTSTSRSNFRSIARHYPRHARKCRRCRFPPLFGPSNVSANSPPNHGIWFAQALKHPHAENHIAHQTNFVRWISSPSPAPHRYERIRDFITLHGTFFAFTLTFKTPISDPISVRHKDSIPSLTRPLRSNVHPRRRQKGAPWVRQ